jgi:hypothetical protein
LTRNQHVLLRLGELVAYAEGAAALARRAARSARGDAHAKTDRRFSAPELATLSRVNARDAAQRVALDGLRWVAAADGAAAGAVDTLMRDADLGSVLAAQAGAIEDMDAVANALYGRA